MSYGGAAISNSTLATITGIDLKSTGQTTLLTVPAGRAAIITDVIVRLTVASAVTVAPIVRAGLASAYTEWLALTTLTGLASVDQCVSLALASLLPIRTVFTAGQVIKLDVQTGATATSMVATAYVVGLVL